jgi:anti-anti-sigma factor
MSLTIKLGDGPSSTKTLHLAGRLDNETAAELDGELDRVLKTPIKTLVFDLGGLDYTTSAGLRAFLRAQKSMSQRSGQTLFVNLQPPVQKVFDIVKVADLAKVFRSVQELDAYLDVMQKKAAKESR